MVVGFHWGKHHLLSKEDGGELFESAEGVELHKRVKWVSAKKKLNCGATGSMDNYHRIPLRQRLPDGTPDYIQLILSSKVYHLIKQTPITHAVNLSQRFGVHIAFKREDLQPVFSFKVCTHCLNQYHHTHLPLPDSRRI